MTNNVKQLNKQQLVAVVKASQRYNVSGKKGSWVTFLQGKDPDLKKTDPAKNPPELLVEFLEHLLNDPISNPACRSFKSSAEFVDRYISWILHLEQQEQVTEVLLNELKVLEAQTLSSTPAGDVANMSHRKRKRPRGNATADGTDASVQSGTVGAAPVDTLMLAAGFPGSSVVSNSVWSLVAKSMAHPRYGSLYDFPSFMDGWIVSRFGVNSLAEAAVVSKLMGGIRASSSASSTAAGRGLGSVACPSFSNVPFRLLAVDCEMCETVGVSKALLSICVTDEQGRVVYDEIIIPPGGPVVNFKTDITGLTAADLEGVTLTFASAQRQILALLARASRGEALLPVPDHRRVYSLLQKKRRLAQSKAKAKVTTGATVDGSTSVAAGHCQSQVVAEAERRSTTKSKEDGVVKREEEEEEERNGCGDNEKEEEQEEKEDNSRAKKVRKTEQRQQPSTSSSSSSSSSSSASSSSSTSSDGSSSSSSSASSSSKSSESSKSSKGSSEASSASSSDSDSDAPARSSKGKSTKKSRSSNSSSSSDNHKSSPSCSSASSSSSSSSSSDAKNESSSSDSSSSSSNNSSDTANSRGHASSSSSSSSSSADSSSSSSESSDSDGNSRRGSDLVAHERAPKGEEKMTVPVPVKEELEEEGNDSPPTEKAPLPPRGDGMDVDRSMDPEEDGVDLDFSHGPIPVVLVGHSLCSDLRAMRMDHWPLIDTSMVFSYEGLPECTPALQDLALLLLRMRMRDNGEGGADHAHGAFHDPAEDARAAMRLTLLELQHAGFGAPVPPPKWRLPSDDLRRLLLFRIPNGVDKAQLRALLALYGAPPCDEIEMTMPSSHARQAQGAGGAVATGEGNGGGGGGTGRAVMIFTHAGLANDAFARLGGGGDQMKGAQTGAGTGAGTGTAATNGLVSESKDCVGRAIKEIALPGVPGVSIKVRKPACHNGQAFGRVDTPPLRYCFQSPFLAAGQAAQEAKAKAAAVVPTGAAAATTTLVDSSRNASCNAQLNAKGAGTRGAAAGPLLGPAATYLMATRRGLTPASISASSNAGRGGSGGRGGNGGRGGATRQAVGQVAGACATPTAGKSTGGKPLTANGDGKKERPGAGGVPRNQSPVVGHRQQQGHGQGQRQGQSPKAAAPKA